MANVVIFVPTPGRIGQRYRRRCRAWATARKHEVLDEVTTSAEVHALEADLVVCVRHDHASSLIPNVVVLEEHHGGRYTIAAMAGGLIVLAGVTLGSLLERDRIPSPEPPAAAVPPGADAAAPASQTTPTPVSPPADRAVPVEVPVAVEGPLTGDRSTPSISTAPPSSPPSVRPTTPEPVTPTPSSPAVSPAPDGSPSPDTLCLDVDLLELIEVTTC